MVKTIPDRDSIFVKPKWGFYAVHGSGSGGVTLFVRKSFRVWLYRLFAFNELNWYVLDQKGAPVNFNRWEELWAFINGISRYNSNYEPKFHLPSSTNGRPAQSITLYTDQRPHSWYQNYWDDGVKVWPYQFDQQFYLELPTGHRQIRNHWIK